MASLQAASCFCSSYSQRFKLVKGAFHVPKFSRSDDLFSAAPKVPTRNILLEELNGFTQTNTILPILQQQQQQQQHHDPSIPTPTATATATASSKALAKLYAVLEAVSDRVEMHHNIGEQRDNWNTLLLNSTNMITLTATAMAGLAAATSGDAAPILALKLSSTLLFSAATGMLLIMNKIQPSQLAEEQRNATRLFKHLQGEIETIIAVGNPTEEDVKTSMEKVLALDKAYPLPLLGAMLEKFPKKFEPAVWWPSTSNKENSRRNRTHELHGGKKGKNGWNEGLELEMREVIEVIKRKDIEDYERLGNLVLKINKSLAIAGPLLSGIAALGSSFVNQGSWLAVVPVMAGALATAVNAFEHGGQVGMVSEMYRTTAGFFQHTENSIQEAIQQDMDSRESGELFEMKLALKLGRSLSQLRDLARNSAYSRIEGTPVDEFASKIF